MKKLLLICVILSGCNNECAEKEVLKDDVCHIVCGEDDHFINGWRRPYTNCWGGTTIYQGTYCEFICLKGRKRLIKSINITTDGSIVPSQVEWEHCGSQGNRCEPTQACLCDSTSINENDITCQCIF